LMSMMVILNYFFTSLREQRVFAIVLLFAETPRSKTTQSFG
jgi:hypothetical protein